MAKGYKLTAATGTGPKTCAFFFSDKGCRNAATCKFSHEQPAPPTPSASAPAAPSVSSSSVCSSESESDGEIVERRAGAYASLATAAVDIRPAHGGAPNPFLSAVSAPVAPPPQVIVQQAPPPPAPEQPTAEKKKRKRKKKDTSLAPGENIFDLATTEASPMKTNAPGAAAPVAAAAPPAKKVKQTVASKKQHPTTTPHNTASPNFRTLQLPVASFSAPVAVATTPKANKRPSSSPTPPPAPAPAPLPSLTLPTATPAHLRWKSAVLATRAHPNYTNAFNFDRAQQYEVTAGVATAQDWIATASRPYGAWCAANPAAVAIDCEMCETKCPTTGRVDNKALCRISVVNAENPAEVLLDTLVKPQWPVSNHRTWVNGIAAADLETVSFTLQHAQLFMQALCSDQTVIVGHAVHNDLLALRLIHHCNLDTALLFSYTNVDDGTCSLKNLAHGVLRRDMPDVHDSVNDARVALECALHYVTKNGRVEPVEKVYSRSRDGRVRTDPADTAMMLVHRLPAATLPAHITEMFLAYTCIKPKRVPEITFSGSQGKCHVEFLTKEHAELAYRSLVGEEKEDKGGKKQKRVGLKGGGYVCVRKMKKGN